jgi:8-oxo-dGTP pyrophosphatase MutT (NUDIX family)
MTHSQFLSFFSKNEVQRFKMKVGVFLFLIHNDGILLLRRYRTGIDDGKYVVPMGGHDGLEPLTSSIIREAYEEANITLQPEQLQVCHVMHRFHPMPDNLSFEQIDVFFKAESFEGEIKNMEPHKCDELEFYPVKALPEKTVGFIRYAIECVGKGKFYSEFGWENH